jgi:hypothetical protein
LRGQGTLRTQAPSTAGTQGLFGQQLSLIGLDADLLALLDEGFLVVDGRVGLFPLRLEVLELLAVDFTAIVVFVELLDFGGGFEFLNNFLVMAAALSSSSVLEILLKRFENLTDPE